MSEQSKGPSDHEHKNMQKWSEIKGENSWTMFKVIAEFVDGFEIMNRLAPLHFHFRVSTYQAR